MIRPATAARVHRAVLALAEDRAPGALTMEGIAVEAGVGKQTLYRNWATVHAILFDALAAESDGSTPHDQGSTVAELLAAASLEMSAEPRATLLRVLAASIHTDERVAAEFRDRLLVPQLEQICSLLAAEGIRDTHRTSELLLAPIFYRWSMRLSPMTDDELQRHAQAILSLDRQGY